MSRDRQWSQYLCSYCDHVNWLPPHGIDFTTIPCAHCGEVSLFEPDVPFRIVMPKFRAGGIVKPQPTST